VMYTSPEVARAGLTETEATEQYGDLLIGRFPFSASGRASIEGAIDGFVKVIAEAKHETIVGTSIFGPQAGHLIAEAALAIQLEAGLDDVAETVHAHPTLSEAFHEAVLDAKGQAIHMPPKAKASR
jgi:dihydrolipoamide dehydrogenase